MLGGARLAAILCKGGDVRRGIAAFCFLGYWKREATLRFTVYGTEVLPHSPPNGMTT